MKNKKICKRCVMDDSIPNISFDENGICSYCKSYDDIDSQYPLDGKQEDKILKIVDEIREKGRGKKYDCVIGVSGGCDSSYLMYLAKKYGLRPLAATFDNTWGSIKAVQNIYNIIERLGIDLHTVVVNGEEFNDLCKSFLYASVPDADIPNDIAITKLYYMVMEEYDVDYFLCGHSFRTEGFAPLGWTYMDGKYIESVHTQFGKVPLKTFPNLDIDYWLKNINKKRIRMLYYIDYNKEEAKRFLISKFNWQWYGGHHFENDYTKFVKSYLLPKKFGIDKRIVELSALVRAGQLDRNKALDILSSPEEIDFNLLRHVIKRLKLTEEELDNIMKLPIKSYKDYDTYKSYFVENKEMFKEMAQKEYIPWTFYYKYCENK